MAALCFAVAVVVAAPLNRGLLPESPLAPGAHRGWGELLAAGDSNTAIGNAFLATPPEVMHRLDSTVLTARRQRTGTIREDTRPHPDSPDRIGTFHR